MSNIPMLKKFANALNIVLCALASEEYTVIKKGSSTGAYVLRVTHKLFGCVVGTEEFRVKDIAIEE
jgi:hypothetical protein